jgi:hypothetical protein
MSKCLFCYQPLAANEQDFHISCSKKIFGQPSPPDLPYSEEDLEPMIRHSRVNEVPGISNRNTILKIGVSSPLSTKKYLRICSLCQHLVETRSIASLQPVFAC